MGNIITEKAKLQILSNDIDRKMLYLEELRRGNRIDELKGYEDQRRGIQVQIDKVLADYQVLKNQRQEVSGSMQNIINQLEDEQKNKKKYEIARDFYTYHSSKRELEKVREEKKAILSKPIFEQNEQVTFIGLETKIDKLKLKINKADLDVKAAERESIEAAALLAKNEKDKRDFEEENEAILRKIKSSFANEYPEGTDLSKRFQEVEKTVKMLELDLNSVAFAKNEFLMFMLDDSNHHHKCFICTADFTEEQYIERKEFLRSTLGKRTEEEEKNMKDLEDFKAEYNVLKVFEPEILKMCRNNQRIIEIDSETEKMFAEAGRKGHKITQALEVAKKFREEELELKDMQLLISREDELEKIIREIDVSRFQGEDEEELYQTYEKGQIRPADLTNMLSDKQKSMCIVDHNMSTLDGRLAELHKAIREVGSKIQAIKDERKNEKSVEEIEQDIDTNSLELDTKKVQVKEIEKAKNKEFAEKEAMIKEDKQLLMRLNYLIPELAKKHTNMMKVNSANTDESEMMKNFRIYKEVQGLLESEKSKLEDLRKEQEHLSKRSKIVGDKITLIDVEHTIRTKENEILTQTEEIKHLANKVEHEKAMSNELTKVTSLVSNLEGKDETHKKSAQEYYDKIYRNRDKEMQYFERLTHYEYYRMLVDDLELYMQSLEEALVKYHKEKIELINKNIAELWKMTYQNGDIKRIEIKAEQIVDANIENKGNFNYRVVFYNKE